MSGNIDESCLIVRNFPASYTEKDVCDFLQMFDAKQVNIYIAHRLAVVEFENKNHARDILILLHQEVLDESRLFVEYAPKKRHKIQLDLMTDRGDVTAQHQSDTDELTDKKCPSIAEGLKRLYATAESLNINQPPPPHLRYEYPKANRNIIDAIAIALECIPKFYIQVLHIMNRMNLEPPFVSGDKTLSYESNAEKIKCATISTQTDDILWQNALRSKRKLIESDESELESNTSDNGEDDDDDTDLCILKTKRMKFSENETPKNDLNKHELLKQKQKKLLKMQRIQKQSESIERPTNNHKVSEAFDAAKIKAAAIKIVMPDQLDVPATRGDGATATETMLTTHSASDESSIATDSTHLWSDSKLNESRIPPDQLKVYPVFQNYAPGEISNRLYVKNIAKDVTEADLRAIFERYLAVNCAGKGNVQSIDIRLMTSGRMKGQAFINFDGPYLNCDVDEQETDDLAFKFQMIEKALNETNGLILKGKPLVVVYGKKK